MEPLKENDKKVKESFMDNKALDAVPGPVTGGASKQSRAAMYKAELGRILSIVQLVCGVLVASSSFVMIFGFGFDLELNGLRARSLVGCFMS